MPNALPDSVQQVAEVIGEEAALKLVNGWPRTAKASRPVVYVPARLTPDHRLVAILGWQTAERLVRVFGGDILFLATCASARRAGRDAEIEEDMRNGPTLSPAVIAQRYGIHVVHARRIMNRLRANIPAMGSEGAQEDHARTSPHSAAA